MGFAKRMLADLPSSECKPCPKCGGEMTEDSPGEMTDGQESDYMAGFNRSFTCDECGYSNLYDIEPDYGPDDFDDFVKLDDKINFETIEDLVDRAIDKRCFIEVISIVHNNIELYLKMRLRDHIYKLYGVTSDSYKSNQAKKIIESENIESKIKLLLNESNKGKNKYLSDYRELCYVLGLINKEVYDMIGTFNKNRNSAIHNLLSKKQEFRYSDIMGTARLGREIQLKLSPLNHTSEDIVNILKKFTLTPSEKEDPFLSGTKS